MDYVLRAFMASQFELWTEVLAASRRLGDDRLSYSARTTYLPQRSFGPSPWGWVLVLLVACGAAITGLAVAVAGKFAALASVSVVLFLAGLLIPLRLLLIVMTAIVLLAVGQLHYFGGVDKAFWIPYLLGMLVHLRLLAVMVNSRSLGGDRLPAGRFILVSIGLFFTVAVASSLINGVAPLQWFVAGKEYFFLWSVLFAFVLGVLKPVDLERLMRFAPWFLALQIPVVLYQRFFVAANRVGSSPFDAVVGLFGGNPEGGGASGAMAMFSLAIIAITIEAWRSRVISGWRTLVTVALAAASIALAEVKFAFVLIPVMALLLYGRELLRQPARALTGLLIALSVTWGLLALYQSQYTSDRTRQGQSIAAYIKIILERNTGTDVMNLHSLELGRVAAFVLWWDSQSAADPAQTLIGRGIGSTRVGSMVVGDVAKEMRVRVGRSTMVIYLWEVGVLGSVLILAALIASALVARRLASENALASQAWMLRGASIGLMLIILGLPYNTDLADVAQIQILAFALMGYVIASGRTLTRRRPAAGGHVRMA